MGGLLIKAKGDFVLECQQKLLACHLGIDSVDFGVLKTKQVSAIEDISAKCTFDRIVSRSNSSALGITAFAKRTPFNAIDMNYALVVNGELVVIRN